MAFLDSAGLSYYDSKLKNSINDYTTGINLVRGTRDFQRGLNRPYQNTTALNDGFSFNSQFMPNKTKDEDGFTCVDWTNRTDQSVAGYATTSLVYGLKKGDIVTISFDFMLIENQSNENRYIANANEVNKYGTRIKWKDFILSYVTGSSSTIEKGVWYPVVIYYTIQSDEIEAFDFSVASVGGQITKFRKINVQRGEIKNPVWSPSPLDSDYNDYKYLGYNGFVGTKDCVIGTGDFVTYGSSTKVNKTGFYIAGGPEYISTVKDSEGFTNFLYKSSEDKVSFITASACSVGKLSAGESVTVGFDIMFGEDFIPASNVPTRIDSSGIFENLTTHVNHNNHSFDQYGISGDIKGVWQHASLAITSDRDIEDCWVLLQLQPRGAGSIYFRKVFVYKGSVINPIWSLSPLELLSAPVPISQGGTGGTTSKAAQYNLLNDMILENTVMDDSSQFIMRYKSPSTTGGLAYIRNASNVWNWIASKIKSIFGFNDSGVLSIEHGGTGSTKAVDGLTALGGASIASQGTMIPYDSDLNTYNVPGTYYSGSSEYSKRIAHSPTTTSGYKLIVEKSYANVRLTQTAYYVNGTTDPIWRRSSIDSGTTWSDWQSLITTFVELTDQTKGKLPIESGGTGSGTEKDARNNLFNKVTQQDGYITDKSNIMLWFSDETDRVRYRSGSALWNYIKSKIEADDSLGGGGTTEIQSFPEDCMDGPLNISSGVYEVDKNNLPSWMPSGFKFDLSKYTHWLFLEVNEIVKGFFVMNLHHIFYGEGMGGPWYDYACYRYLYPKEKTNGYFERSGWQLLTMPMVSSDFTSDGSVPVTNKTSSTGSININWNSPTTMFGPWEKINQSMRIVISGYGDRFYIYGPNFNQYRFVNLTFTNTDSDHDLYDHKFIITVPNTNKGVVMPADMFYNRVESPGNMGEVRRLPDPTITPSTDSSYPNAIYMYGSGWSSEKGYTVTSAYGIR